jgi:hypothetical protein
MNDPASTAVLNRLLQTVYRSLPVYLDTCRPWSPGGDGRGMQAIAMIASARRQLSERIAREIQDLGGPVEPGRFATLFTSLNDVSLDYLVELMRQSLCRDVETIEACVRDLARFPEGRRLAEDSLEMTRKHLAALGLAGVK